MVLSSIFLQLKNSGTREINDSGSGEGNNGKDGTDDGVGADDDQSLKIPSPLPPALPSLPRADPYWCLVYMYVGI